MPTCRECSAQFTIHPNDQKILDYFDAPAPTLCATHSLQQRLAWRNERHLYKRTCELCKKEILAMYSPQSYVHVSCRECWYSDQWDPMGYGKLYDPSRSFVDQAVALMKEVPFFNLWHTGENINCDYSNYIFSCKDCYLSFSCVQSEGLLYCKNTDYSRECTDCLTVLKSELLYDCVSTTESYASAFLTRCQKCSDCYLGRDLQDCQNCFGCVNLKHKQYCWYNEQMSKDEYLARLSRALTTRSAFEEQVNTFSQFSRTQPCEYATIRSSEDASGNEIYNSKSVRSSFFTIEAENCGESYRIGYQVKDVYRMSYGGFNVSLDYEMLSSPWSSMSMGSITSYESSGTLYSVCCFNAQDVIGSVGLRKKQYCILNTQYTKDEYEALKHTIITDMKARGEWGEFFSPRNSFFEYNKTLAHEFFPESSVAVTAKGWGWDESVEGVFGNETVRNDDIPQSIRETQDSLTKEILSCITCHKNYRIIKKELLHLRKLSLPIPHECQDCRFITRMGRYFIPVLYQRQCMCTENHTFHDGRCPTEFETTYRPDGKDVVYCKPCYQEVIQ